MSGDPVFRQNIALVCVAHIVLIVGLILAGRMHKSAPRSQITWIQTGFGDSELIAVSLPAQPVVPEELEPAPAVPEPKPDSAAPPSEIALKADKPLEPIVPQVEAPAPPPKTVPKAAVTKPKPKTKKEPPAPTAKKKAAEPKSTAKIAAKPKAAGVPEPPDTKTTATSAKKRPASSAGTTGGKQGGAASAGGGASEFGWYHSMIHDRFYGGWEQPTSIVSSSQKFSSLVRVRIEKDGRISNVTLAKSSGNVLMDESVVAAAQRVTQIDPLPAGLGESHYEININFELNQDQS